MISIVLIIASCTSYKYLLHNEFDEYYTLTQVDSVCKAEHIPSVGPEWTHMAMKDEETNKRIQQSSYIINQDTLVVVYSLTNIDSLYRLKKRISKKVKQ